tara:strand:- start:5053 stop:5202 length:150 start_codon:yes stop_codon:yes gene_type:complete
MSSTDNKYKIKLDAKTIVVVNGYQIYKPRWINYFGSEEAVDKFIKNYTK